MIDYKIYIATALAMAILFASCQKDDVDCQWNGSWEVPVQLLSGMYEQENGGELTRTLPNGYKPTTFKTDPGLIAVFMVNDLSDHNMTSLTGTYRWNGGDDWICNAAVRYYPNSGDEAHNTYYVYGYMPRLDGVAATLDTIAGTTQGFAAGAKMTLKNVRPISAKDVCIITGVKNGVYNKSQSKWVELNEDGVDIKTGVYNYYAKKDTNAIYIIFDHIYSKVTLRMKVDSAYNTMRTIKVTNMTLTGSSPSVNVVVNYENGENKGPNTTITLNSDAYSISETVLTKDTTLKTEQIDLTEFYCANALTYVTLTTTFDVYDKSGNLMRSNCKASNKIKLQTMDAGMAYTLTTAVTPSYLYQLGETDLDQPTMATIMAPQAVVCQYHYK